MADDDYRAILTFLATSGRYCTDREIAEGCGTYETMGPSWASDKLPMLIKRRFIELVARGRYRVTMIGRLALEDPAHVR